MSAVAFEGVTKEFAGGVRAVDSLDLVIEDHEFLVLLGPSGCGKSTALRMIAGLDDPTAGVVRIGDRIVNDVDPKDRDVAMVFQSYALYPHMTVRKNIEFPLDARKLPHAERNTVVQHAAEVLGLAELLDRKPAQLSGGQRQRVALARAIVRRPSVFLMDEPLSNLDAKLRVQTRVELVALQRSLASTLIYVTHDQVEAMTMGHRIAIMRDGMLQQVGPPQEVYDRPANQFVAQFIGTPPMNTFHAVASARGLEVADGAFAMVDGWAREPQDVIGGIRPEHLHLESLAREAPDGGALVVATVSMVEALGHERHVHCRMQNDDSIIVRVAASDPYPTTGEAVALRADAEHVHVFSTETGQRVALA